MPNTSKEYTVYYGFNNTQGTYDDVGLNVLRRRADILRTLALPPTQPAMSANNQRSSSLYSQLCL